VIDSQTEGTNLGETTMLNFSRRKLRRVRRRRP
jgi:hypothetical protein